MADRLEELQLAVQELAARLRRLEVRVSDLERRGPAPHEPAAAARVAAGAPRPGGIALPQGSVTLFGQTLLVLAGAYVARALTDGRVVPPGVGVALGLAYAVFWLIRADRAARRGRRESAVFLAVTSCVIAFPLVWETTARFGLLGARAACAALVAFFALGLAVAWRQGLAVAAVAVTALALTTTVALLVATRDLLAAFVALLALAAALEWVAYRERWLALRWWAAVVLDAVAFLLVAIVTRPQGLPPGYVPLTPQAAARALLALPALYVAGLAARTLRRGSPVALFEAAQGTLSVLLGFGGAWKILTSHGDSAAGLGVLTLLLGALCYGAAFAFTERRVGQGRNFYFYSTAGGLLTLAGANAAAFGSTLPLVLGGLGLLAAFLGRRFGRRTLRAHSALYLAAGALETGLALTCVRAVFGQTGGIQPAVTWVIALAAAGGWAVLATDPGAPRSGGARAPQFVLGLLVVIALAGAAQGGLEAVLGGRLAADPGLAAAVRTAVVAALALGLALAARHGSWPELGWLVYVVVALGGIKLLLQDLRVGRPVTLVLSLAIYGTVLLLAPRLAKAANAAP
jgi:hypothetical protein